MIELAKKLSVDMVVVAPDDPLVMGMVDDLNQAGFKTFGPNAAAAAIEGSKVFSKDLIVITSYSIHYTKLYEIDYIKDQNSFPAVIKADGLALGKGVVIAQNFDEAKDAVLSIVITSYSIHYTKLYDSNIQINSRNREYPRT